MTEEKHPGLRTRTVVIGAMAVIVCGALAMLTIVYVRAQRQKSAIVAVLASSEADNDPFEQRERSAGVDYRADMPIVQAWAAHLFGAQMFGTVTGVEIVDGNSSALGRLEDLPDLEKVVITHGTVSSEGMKTISNATQLKSLAFRSCDLKSANWASFAAHSQLESLELTQCTWNPNLDFLTSLTSLKSLLLNVATLTDADLTTIGKLASLKSLNFTGCDIPDDGLEHLSSLRQLETLNFGGADVSAAGVQRLQRALPHCKIQALVDYRSDEDTDNDLGKMPTVAAPHSGEDDPFGRPSPPLPKTADPFGSDLAPPEPAQADGDPFGRSLPPSPKTADPFSSGPATPDPGPAGNDPFAGSPPVAPQ